MDFIDVECCLFYPSKAHLQYNRVKCNQTRPPDLECMRDGIDRTPPAFSSETSPRGVLSLTRAPKLAFKALQFLRILHQLGRYEGRGSWHRGLGAFRRCEGGSPGPRNRGRYERSRFETSRSESGKPPSPERPKVRWRLKRTM